MKDIRLEDSWKDLLKEEFEKEYFQNLREFIREEYKSKSIFPQAKFIFRALDLCPVGKVKVVILGQDPYHGPGQAHGLCFSVPKGIAFPPSLSNIFLELHGDLGIPRPLSGDLSRWANQGVLLLNSCLTVEAGKPASHSNKGWETFTQAIVEKLSLTRSQLVYLLWGSFAQKKGAVLSHQNNCILTSPHPSPLSAYRGFLGNKHFSKANSYLTSQGLTPIDWS